MLKTIQVGATGHIWQNAVMPHHETFTTPCWPSLYVNNVTALMTILLRRPEIS